MKMIFIIQYVTKNQIKDSSSVKKKKVIIKTKNTKK